MVRRTEQGEGRWEEVHRRAAAGASIRAIARELDLDRKTARRCLGQAEWRPYQREAREDTLLAPHATYLPIDRQAATLFFQLISRRYERGPMILTSNQSFGNWGDVFGDRVIASAILDRILHHATTISIRGESYRLKDKLKSG